MKYNLLKIVQDILSAMSSDEANTIADTVESRQVAGIVQSVYNNIVARTEFPEHSGVFELTSSNDPAKPIVLGVPIYVDTVDWVQYNSSIGTGYSPLKFYPPGQYIQDNLSLGKIGANDPTISKLTLRVDDSNIDFFYYNKRDPTTYTYIPEIGVITNGVNLTAVDTDTKEQTYAYGRKNYEFDLRDEFVPPLDQIHFNLLIQESKALAFAEIKQTNHAIAEKNAKDSRIHAQRRKDQSPSATFYRNLPNYGRC